MPLYEYECSQCRHQYVIKATFEEKSAGLKTVCPQCGSAKATQMIGGSILLKSGRIQRTTGGSCCGPGSGCCPPPR